MTRQLTEMQSKFVARTLATGSPTLGARDAGYAKPAMTVRKLLSDPAIVAEIRRRETARLSETLLPLAIDRLEKILGDDKESARNHIAAAKLVLDRTLGDQDAATVKEPHEMTADEIQVRLRELKARQEAISDEAIDVTPTQSASVLG